MDFAKVCAVVLAASALGACHRTSDAAPATSASPSTILIGTAPADPTGDPPGTTPVASNTIDTPKALQADAGNREGDNNSHSTLAGDAPQKAGGQDTTSNGSPS